MCSTRNRVGVTACPGQRIPMAAANELVSGALLERVLDPHHLAGLLSELRNANKSGRDDASARRLALARELRKINREIDNPLSLVAKGVMDAGDADLRGQLQRRKARREEVEGQMGSLTRNLEIPTGWAGPRKVEAFAKGLRDLWGGADGRFRQAYLRLLVDNVEFRGEEIRISGSKRRCWPPPLPRAFLKALGRFVDLHVIGVPTGIRTPVVAVKGRNSHFDHFRSSTTIYAKRLKFLRNPVV